MTLRQAGAPIRPPARETWLIMGSRYALTYPVFVLYIVPVALSTVLLAQTAPPGTSWNQWLLLGIISWATPVAALLLMRWTFLPNRARASRPSLTLLAFFIAGFVRALAFNYVESALGVADHEAPWLRLSGGTFTIAITFALIAILVAARFEYRNELTRLSDDRKRLEELEQGLAGEVADARSAVHAEAQRALAPVFDELKSSIGHIHDVQTATQVSERMRDTVDAIVRPLSIQLASRPSHNLHEIARVSRGRHPRVRPDQRLGLGYFFLPFTFAFFIVSMTAASVLFVAGWSEGVLTLTIMFAGLMGALWLLRLATFGVKLPPALGGVLFTLIHVVVAYAITRVVVLVGTSISAELLDGWLVLVGAVAILSHRYQLVEHERRITLTSLAEVNGRLEILLSSLRQQSKVDARRVANILHGPVQTALYASAMRLSQSQVLDDETVQRVLGDLDRAMLALLDGPGTAPELGTFVDELRGVWGARVAINLDADADVLTTLRGNPTAQSCAVEVVREGVNNAIKHGGATRIDIEIFRVEPMLIDISVSNNAPLRESSVSPGFGSSVLDDLTHDWRLTSQDGRTILWASVALDSVQ